MNTLFDILHVVAAVFIVGPMAILPMTAMRAVRGGSGSQVATLARSTTVFSWLSIVVVALGFAVMGTSEKKYNLSITTPWVLWSLLLWLIAGVISLWLVVPAMKRASQQLGSQRTASYTATDGAAAGAPTATFGNPYPVIAAGSGIASLLLVAVVVLMVWKP